MPSSCHSTYIFPLLYLSFLQLSFSTCICLYAMPSHLLHCSFPCFEKAFALCSSLPFHLCFLLALLFSLHLCCLGLDLMPLACLYASCCQFLFLPNTSSGTGLWFITAHISSYLVPFFSLPAYHHSLSACLPFPVYAFLFFLFLVFVSLPCLFKIFYLHVCLQDRQTMSGTVGVGLILIAWVSLPACSTTTKLLACTSFQNKFSHMYFPGTLCPLFSLPFYFCALYYPPFLLPFPAFLLQAVCSCLPFSILCHSFPFCLFRRTDDFTPLCLFVPLWLHKSCSG